MGWRRVLLLGGGGSGGSNVRPAQRLGFRQTLAATLVGARQLVGFAVTNLVLSLRITQRLGFSQTTRVVGLITVMHSAGLRQIGIATGTPSRPRHNAGFRVVHTRFKLDGMYGANAVVETAVATRTDWASDANATGKHNASSATFAGNALGARGGQLEFDYANFVDKSALAIQAVRLHFYVSVAGTLVNNADVRLGWLKSGSTFTILETITGDVASLTTPRTFDISGSITGWSDLDALRACVRAESALGEIWTANVDAVELEVIAESIVA